MAQDPNPAGGDAGVSAEKAEEIRTKLVAQSHCAQANYFLNVYFDTIGDDNETVFGLLQKFAGYGADKSTISLIEFMRVLQDLEDVEKKDSKDLKYPRIKAFPNDGPSVSDKFRASGVEKRPNIAIFDALLAIFGFTLVDTMNLPATPCQALKRAAEARVEEIENRAKIHEARMEDIRARKETAGAVAKGKLMVEEKQAENEYKDSLGQTKKDKTAADRAVAEADKAVDAEKLAGTTATNWLKGKCEKAKAPVKFIDFKGM